MNTANSTIPDETPEWEENEDKNVMFISRRRYKARLRPKCRLTW